MSFVEPSLHWTKPTTLAVIAKNARKRYCYPIAAPECDDDTALLYAQISIEIARTMAAQKCGHVPKTLSNGMVAYDDVESLPLPGWSITVNRIDPNDRTSEGTVIKVIVDSLDGQEGK